MYWLDPTSLTYKVLRVIIFGFMSTYFIPITATDKMGAQKSFKTQKYNKQVSLWKAPVYIYLYSYIFIDKF